MVGTQGSNPSLPSFLPYHTFFLKKKMCQNIFTLLSLGIEGCVKYVPRVKSWRMVEKDNDEVALQGFTSNPT